MSSSGDTNDSQVRLRRERTKPFQRIREKLKVTGPGRNAMIPFAFSAVLFCSFLSARSMEAAFLKEAFLRPAMYSGIDAARNDEFAPPEGRSFMQTPLVEPHVGHKKVLVTGAAGFIGSHVADHLLSRGDDVVIVDEVNDYYDVRIKEANLKMLTEKYGDRASVYRGDICDEEFITDVFEKTKPEWVCHMAARAGVRPSIQDPYVYVHSNVEGTTRLLDLSHQYGVKNFVFASSSSVFGESKSALFSEDEHLDHPISPYAATKKSCELIAYTFHHLYGLNITALRFFTVYGPRGRPDMAPFIFVDRVSRGLEIKKFGDGSSSRDYTYVDDIVDGVVRAVDRPYAYEIFNLGKGAGTSLNEFIALVEKHTGKKAMIKQMPNQPGDVPYTRADVNKARHMLGYNPTIPFEEGIKKTINWYNLAYGTMIAKGEKQTNLRRGLTVDDMNKSTKDRT